MISDRQIAPCFLVKQRETEITIRLRLSKRFFTCSGEDIWKIPQLKAKFEKRNFFCHKNTPAAFKHFQGMGHNINPHCVKVLSDKNIIIKRWVKKAMAIKQRKPSLNRGKGLDLRAIYNPLSGLSESFEVDR